MIDGPRGLLPGELDELMVLVDSVFKSNMRECFPTLFCEENADHSRIIRTDGKIVSHIGVVVRDMIINGCRISVGNVGAICTHQDYRKRGYAWATFENAMDKFRYEGVDMFLVSGYRNLYRLHGCAYVGKVARYQVTPDMELPESKAEARRFSPEDLPAWAALHRNEPVRFHRPYKDFQKLTQPSALRGRTLYSIRENNRITAYAVLGRHRSERGEFVFLDEYAGSCWALLASVRTWCKEFNVPGIGVPVPAHDTELSGLLDSIGAKANYSSTGGTITILHFPRLCRKLKPMFEEILGREMAQKLTFRQQDGSYIISLNGEEAIFDNAHDIARLIFGNPAGRDERTEIHAQGKLRDVLEAIFPIPRPEYGLSYI